MIRQTKYFILTLGLLISTSTFVMAQSGKSIEFKGVSPRLAQELRAKFGSSLQSGRLEDLDNIIRFIYTTNQFENVELHKSFVENEIKYTVLAIPVKKIESIVVVGNSQFSRGEILSLLNIHEGVAINRLQLQEGAETLKERYGEAGYIQAKIGIEFPTTTSGNVGVSIQIDEGIVNKIASVNFISTNTELNLALQNLTRRYLKKNYRQQAMAELEQSVSDYFLENRFLSASLGPVDFKVNETNHEVRLTYSVDRPIQYSLFFEGNPSLSPSDILSELKLDVRQNWGPTPQTELAQRVEDIYKRRGYSQIKVLAIDRLSADNSYRRVTFQIQEGQRTKIRDIKFGGALSRKESYYVKLLRDQSSEAFSSGYYYKDEIDRMAQGLILDLQNQGFLHAKLFSIRSEYTTKNDQINLDLQIDEGPLTKIKGVEFRGITVPEAELRNVITLKKGIPLRLSELDQNIDAVKQFYLDRGYLDMTIENEKEGLVNYNEQGTEAVLQFHVHEGPLVRVGSIVIDGLTLTRDEVVKMELEFKVGDVLTPQKIEDTQFRLQRLGLFSQVDISTVEAGTPVSERTVLVRIQDRNPGFFTSGFGFSNEFSLTARGYLGIAYRNLGGTARSISTRLELKRVTDIDFIDHNISASYLEPYIFNSRTRGRINVSQSKSIIARYATTIPVEEKNAIGFLVERDFSKHFRGSMSVWNVEFVKTLDIFDHKEINKGEFTIGSFGPTIEIDYRDNPVVPRSGTFTRVNLEYADPLISSSSNVKFFRTVGGTNLYIPFFQKRLVWAHSARGGYAVNLVTGPDASLPPTRKFNLGGPETIRGYDYLSIPPGDPTQLMDNRPRVGTDTYFYLYRSEIRFPIVSSLEGFLFYDGGAVMVSGYAFDPSYRHSAGPGIRLVTPVGSFALDWGWKLNRQENEQPFKIEFSFMSF